MVTGILCSVAIFIYVFIRAFSMTALSKRLSLLFAGTSFVV
jgi:hypothetical protein